MAKYSGAAPTEADQVAPGDHQGGTVGPDGCWEVPTEQTGVCVVCVFNPGENNNSIIFINMED